MKARGEAERGGAHPCDGSQRPRTQAERRCPWPPASPCVSPLSVGNERIPLDERDSGVPPRGFEAAPSFPTNPLLERNAAPHTGLRWIVAPAESGGIRLVRGLTGAQLARAFAKHGCPTPL